jgi:hypothetical protein
MLTLKIFGAIAALGIGIWLGMPGRYEQTPEEIARVMELGTGRRKKVKRHFTPFAWMTRNLSARKSQPKRRGGFTVKSPDDD